MFLLIEILILTVIHKNILDFFFSIYIVINRGAVFLLAGKGQSEPKTARLLKLIHFQYIDKYLDNN